MIAFNGPVNFIPILGVYPQPGFPSLIPNPYVISYQINSTEHPACPPNNPPSETIPQSPSQFPSLPPGLSVNNFPVYPYQPYVIPSGEYNHDAYFNTFMPNYGYMYGKNPEAKECEYTSLAKSVFDTVWDQQYGLKGEDATDLSLYKGKTVKLEQWKDMVDELFDESEDSEEDEVEIIGRLLDNNKSGSRFSEYCQSGIQEVSTIALIESNNKGAEEFQLNQIEDVNSQKKLAQVVTTLTIGTSRASKAKKTMQDEVIKKDILEIWGSSSVNEIVILDHSEMQKEELYIKEKENKLSREVSEKSMTTQNSENLNDSHIVGELLENQKVMFIDVINTTQQVNSTHDHAEVHNSPDRQSNETACSTVTKENSNIQAAVNVKCFSIQTPSGSEKINNQLTVDENKGDLKENKNVDQAENKEDTESLEDPACEYDDTEELKRRAAEKNKILEGKYDTSDLSFIHSLIEYISTRTKQNSSSEAKSDNKIPETSSKEESEAIERHENKNIPVEKSADAKSSKSKNKKKNKNRRRQKQKNQQAPSVEAEEQAEHDSLPKADLTQQILSGCSSFSQKDCLEKLCSLVLGQNATNNESNQLNFTEEELFEIEEVNRELEKTIKRTTSSGSYNNREEEREKALKNISESPSAFACWQIEQELLGLALESSAASGNFDGKALPWEDSEEQEGEQSDVLGIALSTISYLDELMKNRAKFLAEFGMEGFESFIE